MKMDRCTSRLSQDARLLGAQDNLSTRRLYKVLMEKRVTLSLVFPWTTLHSLVATALAHYLV